MLPFDDVIKVYFILIIQQKNTCLYKHRRGECFKVSKYLKLVLKVHPCFMSNISKTCLEGPSRFFFGWSWLSSLVTFKLYFPQKTTDVLKILTGYNLNTFYFYQHDSHLCKIRHWCKCLHTIYCTQVMNDVTCMPMALNFMAVSLIHNNYTQCYMINRYSIPTCDAIICKDLMAESSSRS